ncbi:hypothetical protein A3A50_00895 [Candidatus Woesebacteria bacterium RIFCSPLOWO2_01_FULL_38_20]|nr:MAG: hypothetical protein A3A50_00895 [Candidatus Woesebacteria bacterium RIFCSPLOWO2_01_FULL_38_20]
MIKVFYLIWSLLLALPITMLSFFYLRNGNLRGFPFSFAKEITIEASEGHRSLNFNIWIGLLDLFFWWLVFSILLVVVKNYVLEK